MAFNIGQNSTEDDFVVDINTTPLIDVMLVLLIMLIITIPIQTHAVKLDMPTDAPPPTNAAPPQAVTIDVDFDGTVLWNGQIVPDRTTLDRRIETEVLAQADQPEVHIKPNRLATYKYVAAVLASTQKLGVRKLGIVGRAQPLE
jgi:biopolymer transport protein ExbD